MTRCLAVAFTSLTLSTPLLAHADGGFYVGGGLGRSNLQTENSTVTPYIVQNLEGSTTAWKLYGGWKAPALFGVEAGWYNFGEIDASSNGIRASQEMWGLGAFGTVRLGLPLLPIEFIGKAGGVWWDGQLDVTGPVGSGVRNANSLAPAFGLGVEAGLLGVKLRGEYERVQSDRDGFRPVDMVTLSVNYTF